MSENLKISVYCTVFNEESSIELLLRSLRSQTRKPDEIIIVDGGSTDNTVEIIESFIKDNPSIKLVTAKGSNVAQGRNIGIKNTKYDFVASTDAGCIADKNWIKNLVKNFDDGVDIVTGICLPDAKNTFEECFAEILYPKEDDFKADWPSHQNIAFRKDVWKKINYPDKCYRSEDTWFNLEAKERGFKFKLAKDAIIYWRPRKNLREVFKNSYLWTKSNIENDVRREASSKIALNCLLQLGWYLLSIFMLLFVFTFMSKLGALLLSPFILKNIVNMYRKDKKRSIIRIIYKNLIFYTDMLACGFGLIAAKIGGNIR